MSEDLWVLLPAGQRRDGGWLDDTLSVRSVEAGVADRAPAAGDFPRQRVELFRGPGAEHAVGEAFRRRGWTDGLPIVAPSTDRVADLVAAAGRAATDTVGELAPLNGVATVEKLATNAVMAGCGPEQFPFVMAAVSAIVDPTFNLAGVQTTDENATPLVIVSAPRAVRRRAELHAGTALLGPGWRGNATIGRALRLVMQNLGGGWPAAVSMAGAGQPGRYTLCAVEDDEACPWPPLRCELGFDVTETALVVLRAESAVNVTGGLAEITSAMSCATSLFTALRPNRAAVLLAPATAAALAAQGCSRLDVARQLVEAARIDPGLWQRSWVAEATGDGARSGPPPVLGAAEDLVVFVAGGQIPIPQHVWFPSWGFPAAAVVRPVVFR